MALGGQDFSDACDTFILKCVHLDVFVYCTRSLQIAPIDVTLRDIPFEFLQKRGILVEMSEWLAQSSNQCLNSTEFVRSQQGVQSVSENNRFQAGDSRIVSAKLNRNNFHLKL